MTLRSIKNEIEKLCYDVQIEPGLPREEIQERTEAIRKTVIHDTGWIQKTEHLQGRILGELFNLPGKHDFYGVRWQIAVADGLLEEAILIDTEERSKGIPKPIDTTPGPIDESLVQDDINLAGWLSDHGEGVVGPSWWMSNPNRVEEDNLETGDFAWTAREIVVLNRLLKKESGRLVPGREDHVFRFVGKGVRELDEWVVDPNGDEHLFAVFHLDNDPGRVTTATGLDINLERWFEAYGEEEHPAKMMCPTDDRKAGLALNKQLKDLDGTPVGENHVWRFVGRKAYKKDGSVNLFGCVRKRY